MLVRNNTNQTLELWDVGNLLARLPPGQAAQQLPITVTTVSLNTVTYANRTGSFVAGDSYSATSAGGIITFAGNNSTVTFS